MKNNRIRLFLCVYFCLFVVIATKAQWQIPVQHFTYKDYHAGTQNWDILTAQNGWCYAANNYGLLEFDGDVWKLYGIHNSTPIRSLMQGDKGEIYVGATNEFGVFRSDSRGGMQYFSLSDNIVDSLKNFGEVWNIHRQNDNLFFQTDNSIIRLKPDGNFDVLVPGSHIFCSVTIGEAVYVATADGVFLLSNNSFNKLSNSEILAGSQVRGILPLEQNNILIATFDDGLYVYDGTLVKPFNFVDDQFVRTNKIYCLAISDHQLAIGTVRNGIVLVNLKDNSRQYFNHDLGLQNNTVLSVFFDRVGNLVAGLDNGIDIIYLQSPYREYMSPKYALGSGYCSLRLPGGNFYFGTNQGLYYLDKNSKSEADLQFLPMSAGQVWNLDTIAGNVLGSLHKGLYLVQGTKMTPLCEQDGFWHVRRLSPRFAIAGSYSGFFLLQIDGKKMSVLRRLKGWNHTSMAFEVDATGKIWALSPKGLCRLSIDADMESVAAEEIYDYKYAQDYVKLFRLNDRIVITGEHFCRVVGSDGVLREDHDFFQLLNGEHFYRMVRQNADNDLWYMYGNVLAVRKCVDREANTYQSAPRLIMLPENSAVVGFEFLDPFEHNQAVVGMVGGFSMFDCRKFSNSDNLAARLYIRAIELTHAQDSIVYGESLGSQSSAIRLDYKYNSIRVRFGGMLTPSGKMYQTMLEPEEQQYSPWTERNTKEYTSLHEGTYTFHVRVQDMQTGEMQETSVEFTILPPWYRSGFAFCFYIVVICIMLFMIYTYFEQRIIADKERYQREKQQELHEREMQHIQESAQWERQILELQKEKATFELKNKSQELSSLLLNQVNRKEFADSVHDDVSRAIDELEKRHVAPALRILRELNQRVATEGSEEVDWKRFEENFDIVNDKFIRKLTAMYPWLSKNERHLCVYIRMGLYTKEIAPLLNLSVRGVEMLRYRMRKKMGLEREDNLEQYFRSLSDEQ